MALQVTITGSFENLQETLDFFAMLSNSRLQADMGRELGIEPDDVDEKAATKELIKGMARRGRKAKTEAGVPAADAPAAPDEEQRAPASAAIEDQPAHTKERHADRINAEHPKSSAKFKNAADAAATEVETKVAETPAPASDAITLEMVNDAAKKALKVPGVDMNALADVLAQHGAQRISGLKPENYAGAYAAFCAIVDSKTASADIF
jgi:hypothetical protein